ncbi:D-inositol-3-phosphate glycosyltransferase [Methylobacterium crusticola]|uniref:D-inositol-3-phosphate glycosyltransferase n=1 Tax=Methylobacterium crusticola TaxID=1697972 RepID=A0ABQ4R4N8_9HYPH|nr:GT4 family glycosyltransferase PelF [Methylobacterium crusticola]GJD52651.1 D-inositol-3-phosphate glycosyltransferase [Methylobacterium crusticola]
MKPSPPPSSSSPAPSAPADVCLLVEGGYPYLLGGVSSWVDSFIRNLPHRSFHVVAFTISAQPRTRRFELPENVIALTDVVIDACPPGAMPIFGSGRRIEALVADLRVLVTEGTGRAWTRFARKIETSGLAQRALLDSRPAWVAFQRLYDEVIPGAPLVDVFWTWRFLARSMLAIATAPIPPARTYHAISTGYPGLFGARAKALTGNPFLITEHGIYTNERRIELSVADWIYESSAAGYDVGSDVAELRKLWLSAFNAMARISYDCADLITTQFRANQDYQMQDGAEPAKLRAIPNGIELAQFSTIARSREPRRPRVLLVGRLVPIKDIRTFIQAMALLRRAVPDLDAMVVGPDDEDPAYAAECRHLVQQLGLQDTVRFLGRVADVRAHFGCVDVLALTSISEAQPLALLEAGAAGVPAVTTDVGSCREILEGPPGTGLDGAGGFVVGACDPQATADALARLLVDPALRQRMGDALRERIHAVFDQRRVIAMYDDVYASLSRRSSTA